MNLPLVERVLILEQEVRSLRTLLEGRLAQVVLVERRPPGKPAKAAKVKALNKEHSEKMKAAWARRKNEKAA